MKWTLGKHPNVYLNLSYRQSLLLIFLNFLIKETGNLGFRFDHFFFGGIFSGKEQVPPKATGFSTNDVDSSVHISDWKTVERETNVKTHPVNKSEKETQQN